MNEWKCLNCRYLDHSPFAYYGGATGWSNESLECGIYHFYLASLHPDDIRAAIEVGAKCQDFEPVPQE